MHSHNLEDERENKIEHVENEFERTHMKDSGVWIT